MGPLVELTVDEVLTCLPDVLGRRRMDPERPGRFDAGGFEARDMLPGGCVPAVLSGCTDLAVAACASDTGPSLGGAGNCVSLKSVDADSKLVWRSSKLTDGRKSYES
jgi:hypothetical protein